MNYLTYEMYSCWYKRFRDIFHFVYVLVLSFDFVATISIFGLKFISSNFALVVAAGSIIVTIDIILLQMQIVTIDIILLQIQFVTIDIICLHMQIVTIDTILVHMQIVRIDISLLQMQIITNDIYRILKIAFVTTDM